MLTVLQLGVSACEVLPIRVNSSAGVLITEVLLGSLGNFAVLFRRHYLAAGVLVPWLS